MRSGHLLFSAVQFLFTFLILLIGGFFIGLHYTPHLCFVVGQFFIEQSSSFIPIGLSILGCGILLLIGFYAMNRGAYFRFLVPANHAEIEAALLRSYVKKYWNGQFPENEELAADVILHRDQKMEISLEMPAVERQDDEQFLAKVETDLRGILSKNFGYKHDFFLTVTVK